MTVTATLLLFPGGICLETSCIGSDLFLDSLERSLQYMFFCAHKQTFLVVDLCTDGVFFKRNLCEARNGGLSEYKNRNYGTDYHKIT